MSNTRRAESGKPLRQERWCSSDEFGRGLMANIVARRCSVLDSPEDRELLYHIQYRSHQKGGVSSLAKELIEKFPARLGTRSMQRFGMKPGQVYTATQVKAIRRELGAECLDLPLRGDADADIAEFLDRKKTGLEDWRPDSYKLEEYWDRNTVVSELPDFLEELCLKPSADLHGPWYFPDLIKTLREYFAEEAEEMRQRTVTTAIGSMVFEEIDYALESKCMVLVDGPARIGKTFAAKAFCEQRPGRVRYVQVPSAADDIGFFRAIARALGVSINVNSKAAELRQRIEDTLQYGHLAIVFDEAHWCFPTSNYRDALPGRVNWILTALVNLGVPVALVTTPQFFLSQKTVERKTHWSSEQLTGRIDHRQKLPSSLSHGDLAKVARALLPEGDMRSINALADYAEASVKYLAAIESTVRRARYLAKRDHRDKVTSADVRRALTEGVIPSDTALRAVLDQPANGRRRRFERPLQAAFNGDERADQSGTERTTNLADRETLDPTPGRRDSAPRVERLPVPS
jgi:hypothetical protein